MSGQGIVYVIMILYFAVVLGIGYAFRKQESLDDYGLAGRSLTTPVFVATSVATWIGAGSIMGLGGQGYTIGIGGYWWAFGWAALWCPIFIGWLGARRIRRTGLYTISDVVGERFDDRSRVLSAVLLLFYTLTQMTLQVISAGVIVNVLLGIPAWVGAVVGTLVMLTYTVMGGLKAEVWTDVLQFGILIPAFLAMLIFYWIKLGGTGVLVSQLPQHFDLFRPGSTQIWAWLLSIGPGVTLATYTWQRLLAAKDERTARAGSFYSYGFAAVYYLVPFFLGICAAAAYPGLKDPQQAVPKLILGLHPALAGIMLAAFLAVLMSSADSILLYGATTFTQDIYRRFINPAASQRKLAYVARLATLLMGLFALAWGLWMPVIMPIWNLGYAVLSGALFCPVWVGLLWKRATPDASFWTMLVCAIVYSVLYFVKPFGLDPIFFVLPFSAVLIVVLSFLTTETPRERLERIFG